MRILQLIDSLETGGAERVAVNFANAFSDKTNGSFLCATRKEGILKDSIKSEVGYLFLNKQSTFDLKAIKILNRFIKTNKINIIHAHSSSFFLATIIIFFNRKVSVIWHDHYGNSEFLENRSFVVLKFCSKYFSHVFSVNKDLETWAKQKLKIKNVSYLPNFAKVNKQKAVTTLKGIPGKRIICLANLRPQKDHFTLIKAFKNVLEFYPDWTLHCVGKNFNDAYSNKVNSKIIELGIDKSVFLYGNIPDVYNVLSQCEIGVLSSKSEGLPISLLEYGLANLAVVATKVGECENVISSNINGLLVDSLNVNELVKAICLYIENETLRKAHSSRYKTHIEENFSEQSQLEAILNIYKKY